MKSKTKFGEYKHVHMLTICSVAAALTVCAALCGGCGKPHDSAQPPAVKQPKVVDGSAVLKVFSSADPSIKYPVQDTVRVAESGGLADALPQLQKIEASPLLTAEQKKALQDFIQQIQTHWAQQRK